MVWKLLFRISQLEKKAIDSYIEHFGVTNPRKAEKIKLKAKQTSIERYGVENYTKSEEYKLKTKQTNLKKYGVESYSQTLDYHKKAKKHYVYKNETFDSFPELCLYLYAQENKLPVVRTPVQLPFTFNNKNHIYIPDFKIDDVLYEIKGDQFLKEDGTWQCPFDHSLDELFEAKHQCALQNKVMILYHNDYKKYIDWFYKKGYIKSNFIV